MKKVICVLLVVVVAVLGTACSACIKHIEDVNGEDTALCVITENEIIRGSHVTVQFYSSQSDVSVGNGRKISYKVGKLSGVERIGSVQLSGEDATFTFNVSLTGGNARVVVVSGGKIVGEAKVNGESVVKIENGNGSYDIKVAGESAKLDLSVVVTKS